MMKMKKIVVTGATSMIGVALIQEAIKNNVKVLALVRENSSRLKRLPESELIKCLACDVDNIKDLRIDAEDYDVFYHMAWNYTDKEGRKNPKLQALNITTTLDAVELACRLGCRKFVGAGSQAEYGHVNGIITHDTHAEPEIPYGIAKNAAGKLSRNLCDQLGMKFVWGRIFSVYGKYDNEGTMINYAIDQFIKGEEAHFSASTQKWNYLHEQDAGRAFYLLGECKNTSGIYCVANNKSDKLSHYIETMGRAFGPDAKYVYAAQDDNNKAIELNADISKLYNDTGFEPKVHFEDGIKEVIEFRKEMWL